MNNVKKLLAVLIVVTMLVTAMIPVMAADTFSYEDQATDLTNLGLMIGDETGMNLGGDLTRAEGATLIVRLNGAEEAALALTDAEITDALKDYTDKEEIADWAKPYVAYATIMGYLEGRDDGSFDPKGDLLGKDYCTMILRAMGYEVDADDWDVAASLLVEYDGLSTAEAIKFNDKALIRDDAAGITYAALSGEVADGGSLIAALVAAGAVDADDAVASGLYTKPVAADVKDIAMSNKLEAVVTFTAPINATEAAKVANYLVGTVAPTAVSVAADNKSVTLTATATTANYASVNVKVLKAVGIPADVTKSVQVVDITVPTLVSATPTGPKTIKLTFSEPLDVVTASDVVASLKLDNGTIAITSGAVAAFSKTITISTFVDLSESTHTIALNNSAIKDLAGYIVQSSTVSFSYVKDVSPLSYAVTASTETSVTIKFNKAITANSFDGNTQVYATHTYNTNTNKILGAADAVNFPTLVAGIAAASDNQTFTLTFDKPLPPGVANVYVGYTVASPATKIKDGYGNVMEAFSFTVNTAADTIAPIAKEAKFVDADTITITFSEPILSTTAAVYDNFVIKDAAEKKVDISTGSLSADKLVMTLNTTLNALNGTTYNVTVKGIKDCSVAQNVMAETVLPLIGVSDKVAPAFADPALTRLSTTKAQINFTEAMDTATITNKLVYKFNDVALTADDTITATADGKGAIITFKTAPAAPSTDEITISSATMRDLAGNWIDGYKEIIPVVALTHIGGSAALTSTGTIKVTVEDIVNGLTTEDFVYSVGVGAYNYANSIAVEYDTTKTYVTLYINDIAQTTATNIAVKTNGERTTVKNAYNNTVMFEVAQGSVTDKCAAKILNVYANGSTTATLTKIAVEFSEPIYGYSVHDTDFTVAGYTISSVKVSESVVILNVAAATGTTSVIPAVTLVGSVEDNATTRNAVTGLTKNAALNAAYAPFTNP